MHFLAHLLAPSEAGSTANAQENVHGFPAALLPRIFVEGPAYRQVSPKNPGKSALGLRPLGLPQANPMALSEAQPWDCLWLSPGP